uniref:Ankyrin repeat protein n=1 Tax=Peronospora matthiolae TaxID=2874970 RepID=A0AAV1U5X0_9STRA
MFNFIAEKLNVKNLGELLAPTLTPEQELHAAIEQGLTDKVLHLLDEENVDPNVKNEAGNLPIHTAAYHGHVDILTILLTHKVDVNVTCPRQNSPLHYAAAQSRDEAVRFLVDNGANPALRNRQGRTAYDVAKGDNIRQYLLPLQFRHEDPAQVASQLPPGITPSVDPMAPRPVIAPPPLSGDYSTMPSHSMMAAPPQQMPQNNLYAAATHSAIPRGGPSRFARPKDYRPIQADGFGSSVGNDELTAKFGNTREVKVTAPPPSAMATPEAAPTESVPVNSVATVSSVAGVNPYASTFANKLQPSSTGGYPGQTPPGAGTVARGPPQFKIFNPKLADAASVSGSPATFQPPASGSVAAPIAPPNHSLSSSYMVQSNAPGHDEEVHVSTTDSVLQ